LEGLGGSMPEVGREFKKELEESQFRFENEKIWKDLGIHIDRKEFIEIELSYWLVINDVLDPRHTGHPQKVKDFVEDYRNIHDVHNAKAANGTHAAAWQPFENWTPFIVFYKTNDDFLERKVSKNIEQVLDDFANTRFERTLEDFTEYRETALKVVDNTSFIKTFFHELVHHHYQKRFDKDNLPDDHNTVTEIFAWNISRHFLDGGDLHEPAQSYNRPEVIAWGADRVEEMKNRRDDLPDDRYDWMFEMQETIFEQGKEHKRESKFPQDCLDIFVIEMLPHNERKKVYGIVSFTGDQFKDAFEDLEEFLHGIHEEATQDTDKAVMLRTLLNKLEVLPGLIKDSANGEEELFAPEKFRDRILNDVTGRAIDEKLELAEIIELVNEHIDEEAKHLLKIIKDLRKLYDGLEEMEHTDAYSDEMTSLKSVVLELRKVERKLEMVMEA
ncbi:MAG: hypothetical protein ABEJ36_04755, partial [Candidatus Nanosalina sp.]